MSQTLTQRAYELGADHAEAEAHGKPHPSLYSGKQIADALGITETLGGLEYVALHDSYQRGQSDYW